MDVRAYDGGLVFDAADFGLKPAGTGQIGDFIWLDANKDGVQDTDEDGLPGITVTLEINIGGIWYPVETTVTDADGKYLFDKLSAGDKQIFLDSAKEAVKVNRARVDKDDANGVAELRRKGMNIVENVDKSKFIATMGPAMAEFEKQFGKANLREFDPVGRGRNAREPRQSRAGALLLSLLQRSFRPFDQGFLSP